MLKDTEALRECDSFAVARSVLQTTARVSIAPDTRALLFPINCLNQPLRFLVLCRRTDEQKWAMGAALLLVERLLQLAPITREDERTPEVGVVPFVGCGERTLGFA
ncbi:MAG: hypothetical protein ACI8TQ_004014 [Planctomycetota bacterium]|jgi:hypothetical protein